MSARLAEFSAYYSNRMSYDEVAGLLERVTGQPVLSDQTIQHLVVAKAVEVSQQWQSESQADTAAPLWPEVMPQVDWYDPQSEEVLLLTDAIQVKQQRLLLDSRDVDLPRLSNPIVDTLSSLKPLFFNGPTKALHFSDNVRASDPGIQ